MKDRIGEALRLKGLAARIRAVAQILNGFFDTGAQLGVDVVASIDDTGDSSDCDAGVLGDFFDGYLHQRGPVSVFMKRFMVALQARGHTTGAGWIVVG